MRKNKTKKECKNLRKPTLFSVCVALGTAAFISLTLIVLRAIAFKNPAVADAYSKKVFRHLAKVFSSVVNLFPFSLTEVCVVGGIVILIALTTYGIVRLIRYPAWLWRRLLKSALVALTAAFCALSLFIAFHGIHYARSPLAESLGLTVKKRSCEELEHATIAFARAACEAREGLPEDEHGVLIIGSKRDLFRESHLGWEKAGEIYPALKSSIRPVPKGVILSHYWSYTHIVGMYMPLLVEVNINIDQPDYAIPATAAHEIAHARGFAREDDTSLAGYISCFCHPDPVWRYSGLINAWKELNNRLYQEDRGLWEKAYAHITPAVARDLNAEREYWKAFETPVAAISTAVNDAYLKANKEDDGVKTYGQVVDLLLAYIETVDNP